MGFKILKPYYIKKVISGVSIYRLILLHILRLRAVVHFEKMVIILNLSQSRLNGKVMGTLDIVLDIGGQWREKGCEPLV